MYEWNGSNDKVYEQHAGGIRPGIRQEVWSHIRLYLVEDLVHFIFFCLTLILILLITCLSFLASSLCESLFHEVPIIIEIILYLSDICIFLKFIKLTRP